MDKIMKRGQTTKICCLSKLPCDNVDTELSVK